jgi:hypothetical protein
MIERLKAGLSADRLAEALAKAKALAKAGLFAGGCGIRSASPHE